MSTIEEMTLAWRFIFNHHPRGNEIMDQISERPESITSGHFRIWFSEAEKAAN